MSALPEALPFPERSKRQPDALIRRADRVGATASFLCALHCASWPFLLAALPALGASVLASELLERGFIVFATVLALASLVAGWRRHGSRAALGFAGLGLGLLWFGAFGPFHHDVVPHAILMTLGGLGVAWAHLCNQRLLVTQEAAHVHGPNCGH
jgi:hypothetical protein